MKVKERMLISRQSPVEVEVQKRIDNFDEIIKGYTEASALIEAQLYNVRNCFV